MVVGEAAAVAVTTVVVSARTESVESPAVKSRSVNVIPRYY